MKNAKTRKKLKEAQPAKQDIDPGEPRDGKVPDKQPGQQTEVATDKLPALPEEVVAEKQPVPQDEELADKHSVPPEEKIAEMQPETQEDKVADKQPEPKEEKVAEKQPVPKMSYMDIRRLFKRSKQAAADGKAAAKGAIEGKAETPRSARSDSGSSMISSLLGSWSLSRLTSSGCSPKDAACFCAE